MIDATVQVIGPSAQKRAEELRGQLADRKQAKEHVGPVDVERSPELVIAAIGLAFSGVGTAKTIWDWWKGHKDDTDTDDEGISVRVVFADGDAVELSGLDGNQFNEIVRRRTDPTASN